MKIRGYRVELAEIEHAARALPGISQVAAVPVRYRDIVELAMFYAGSALDTRRCDRRAREVAARLHGAALGVAPR